MVEATTDAVIDPSDNHRINDDEEEEKEAEQENGEQDRREKLYTGFNCMVCFDDGLGMTPLELHRMLSFGHCDKVSVTINSSHY